MPANITRIKRAAIKAVLSNPLYGNFKGQELAEMFGVSRQAIVRIGQEVKVAMADAEPYMAEYQDRLLEELPVAERVKVLVDMVKDEGNPKRLEALRRVDDLTGVMTAQEKARFSQEVSEPRPLFSLPDGSFPRITVEVESEDPVIDITEEPEA